MIANATPVYSYYFLKVQKHRLHMVEKLRDIKMNRMPKRPAYPEDVPGVPYMDMMNLVFITAYEDVLETLTLNNIGEVRNYRRLCSLSLEFLKELLEEYLDRKFISVELFDEIMPFVLQELKVLSQF